MSNRGYLPQLDALRAFAVAGVIWSHWTPALYHFGLPWAAGVQLFFVLSGFLITGLLLDARATLAATATSREKGRLIRNFYARRFLRLCPLFYGILVLGLILNLGTLRQTYPWHFSYLSNYAFIRQGGWDGWISHFWTLAVEEQFYLFWPLLVLAVPLRHMAGWFLGVALVGFLFRCAGAMLFPQVALFEIATPAQMDNLALGALLAWLTRNPHAGWVALRSRRRWILLGLVGLWVALGWMPWVRMAGVLRGTVLGLIFFCVVQAVAEQPSGPIGRLLWNPVLRYLGRISYGIYLWHNFADYPARLTFNSAPWLAELPHSLPVAKAAWTLGLAAASWHLLERPINSLKRHFPYG